MKGFIQVNRALIHDHLLRMSGAATQLFLYAAARASWKKGRAGTFASTFVEMAEELGWSEKTVRRAASELSPHLLRWSGHGNQHQGCQFQVVPLLEAADENDRSKSGVLEAEVGQQGPDFGSDTNLLRTQHRTEKSAPVSAPLSGPLRGSTCKDSTLAGPKKCFKNVEETEEAATNYVAARGSAPNCGAARGGESNSSQSSQPKTLPRQAVERHVDDRPLTKEEWRQFMEQALAIAAQKAFPGERQRGAVGA